MYELTSEETAEFKDVIEEYSGLSITDEAVAALVSPVVFGEIRQFGIGDTETNSVIASAFSTALVGRDWPYIYERQQGLDMDAFYASVRAAAQEKGWLAQ